MPMREIRDKETGEVIGHAIVCSRAVTPKCEFCRRRDGTQLCDYPTAPGKTCDKRICRQCSARPKGKDEDYCPDHRERAGLGPPLRLDLEGARWIRAKYDGRCLMMRCGVAIEAGDEVLYLPNERGVLCDDCGKGVAA